LSGDAAVHAARWLASAGAGGAVDRLPEDPAEGQKRGSSGTRMLSGESGTATCYPVGLVAALRGDTRELTKLWSRFDERPNEVAAWLAEATPSRDE